MQRNDAGKVLSPIDVASDTELELDTSFDLERGPHLNDKLSGMKSDEYSHVEQELVRKYLPMEELESIPTIQRPTYSNSEIETHNRNVGELVHNYEERIRKQKESIAKINVSPLPQSPQSEYNNVNESLDDLLKKYHSQEREVEAPEHESLDTTEELVQRKDDMLKSQLETELIEVNQMLLQNGFIPISNESDRSIAQSIRDSFLAILPEYQRRGKELVKQFEDRKEWKTKIQKLQDKLLECHKTIAVYKKQVEEIQNDTRKNKEQDVLHQRDHQKEVLVLRREVENLKAKADGYESIAKRKEQEIMQLKQQLEKQVKSEEDKNKEAKNIFEQFHAKSPHSNAEKKETQLISMYESQRSQLLKEIETLKEQVRNPNSIEYKQLLEDHKTLLETCHQVTRERNESRSNLIALQQEAHHLQKQQLLLLSELESRPRVDQLKETEMEYRQKLMEVCRILDLTDPNALGSIVQKMKMVIAAVPRMEKFIIDVCEACKKNVQLLNQSYAISPKNVVPLIQIWGAQLRDLNNPNK